MLPTGSITILLQRLQAGDEAALAALHARCWPALVGLARARLRYAPVRMVDEDDVAQEALWGFMRALRAGRVACLDSRHHFFALLTHITACKAAGILQRELGTTKRGKGQVVGEGSLTGDDSQHPGLAGVPGRELPPDEEAALRDAYAYFLDGLDEPLREIAELYLAGITNREVAQRLSCSDRTIERKLVLIRDRWQELARPLTSSPTTG